MTKMVGNIEIIRAGYRCRPFSRTEHSETVGERSEAAARAIVLSVPAIWVKCPPCLSWRAAIDENEISGDLIVSHEVIACRCKCII